MRIAVYDEYRIGLVEADGIRDVSELVPAPPYAPQTRINEFVARFEELRPELERRRVNGHAVALESVRLRAPVPAPANFLAAPLNYAAHGDEVRGVLTNDLGTARELGFFVKAGGSISGPQDPLELPPLDGRRFDHEAEVAIVIGREARAVPRERALDHVFGYTLLIDATMRMTETQREERPMRKSFHSFAPTGPWVVTADEIGDPSGLEIRLWVNGELRQHGQLRDLIVDVPGLVAHASSVLTLQPGDLYATGTPAGIGPIAEGDEIVIECEPIGRMEIPVTRRAW